MSLSYSLFQRRKLCSPSKVRVHRFCRLNDSMLHPKLSCPTTSTKEVTNELISKISTNYMALPISCCMGVQIPFQDSDGQSCEDGGELRESLFGATRLWCSWTECSYCCDGSPPGVDIGLCGYGQRENGNSYFLTNYVIWKKSPIGAIIFGQKVTVSIP